MKQNGTMTTVTRRYRGTSAFTSLEKTSKIEDRRSHLARKHDDVCAIEHRVGHVSDLGARRARVRGHRLEHLRRDDDGLSDGVAHVYHPLLLARQPLLGDLHSQVAARHHDGIRLGEDLIITSSLHRKHVGTSARRHVGTAAQQHSTARHVTARHSTPQRDATSQDDAMSPKRRHTSIIDGDS
jgi:hypothetical protein